MEYHYLVDYVLREYKQDLERFVADIEYENNSFDYCIVLGMGGSGIIGRYLRSIVQARWGKPVFVFDYTDVDVPLNGKFLLIAVSYSGTTRETIESFKEISPYASSIGVVSGKGELAELGFKRGARIVEVGGSPAPRFGFAKMLSAALSLFAGFTGERWVVEELKKSVEELAQLSSSDTLVEDANRLAGFLSEGVPIIYSSQHLLPVGYRWKTQLNENAKTHAFHSALPEANHNEVNANPQRCELRCVLLMSHAYSKLIKASFEAYSRVSSLPCRLVWARGSSALSEMLYTTVYGDYVSVRLAELFGVDPLRVEAIRAIKSIQSTLLK
ncbi:MAG: bifunctional phosphoglucose/phosphomannose isomerase [Thermoprotei archaeon]